MTSSHTFAPVVRIAKQSVAVLSLATLAIVTLFAFEAAPMRGATNEALAWSCSIQADSVATATGADVTLRWSSASDVTYVSIDYFPGEQFPQSGTKSFSITKTTTFTAYTHVANRPDTLQCKVTVTVTPPHVDVCADVDLTINDKTFTWSGTQTLEEYTVEFCDGTKETQYVCYEDDATIHFDKRIKSVKACGGDCYREATQSCPPPPPQNPVCDISADPVTITEGTATTLSWWSDRATRVEFEGFSSALLEGSLSLSPATTTTYTGTFYGAEGTEEAICSTTVTVVPKPKPQDPVCTINANPVSVVRGNQTLISWTSDKATSVVFNGLTSSLLDGSQSLAPATTTTYTGTFHGAQGTNPAVCAVTVTVTEPPVEPENPVCSIHANPSTVVKGGSSTLTWTSNHASSVLFTGILSSLLNGTATVSPATTTSYTGTFRGAEGTQNAICSTTVTVIEEPTVPLPVCTMTITPTQTSKGSTATLSWTSDNATSATINQGLGTVSLDGSQTVTVNDATTYTGTFANSAGKTVTCSANVSITTGGGGGGGRCLNCDDDDKTTTSKKDKKPSIVLSAKTTKPGTITLDQVPYTGFKATPLMTALFWITILAISGAIAYAITLLRHRMTLRTADSTIVRHEAPAVDYSVTTPAFVRTAPRVEPIALVQMTNAHQDVQHSIEELAHRDNILLSPEATRMIIASLGEATVSRDEHLNAIFEKAKTSYPREDGWILLSKERCAKLLSGAMETPVTPVARAEVTENVQPVRVAIPTPVATTTTNDTRASRSGDTVVSTFVRYLTTNDQQKTFELIRNITAQGVDIGTFIGKVVRDLDEVYKQRIEGNRKPDQALVQLTEGWSTAMFETVLGSLVECIDYSYTNTRIGAKVALAKAFEQFASSR